MAHQKRSRDQAWPEEAGDKEHGLYSLHRMFDIVGTHLTHRDVRVLSFLFVDVIDDYERGMIRTGRDFLLALERQGRCDETNFRQVLQLLRIITRHDLLPYVTLKRRRAGEFSCLCGATVSLVLIKKKRRGLMTRVKWTIRTRSIQNLVRHLRLKYFGYICKVETFVQSFYC